jgi:hypothetical protein
VLEHRVIASICTREKLPELQLYLCSQLGTKKAVLTLELFQNKQQDGIQIYEKLNYISSLINET